MIPFLSFHCLSLFVQIQSLEFFRSYFSMIWFSMSPFVGCLLLLTGPAELVGRGGGGGSRGRLAFEGIVEGGDCAGVGSVGKLSIEGGVGGDCSVGSLF
jgi:hypothetical protein